MGCLTGNPVHVGIGNKFQEEVDYVSGAGSLSFIRYFNSDIEADQDGALGGGWRHSYSRSIATNQISGIQTASVSRPDGKVFFFTLEGGKWMPDSDVSTGLVQSATGWWYTTGGDEVESYDASGNLLSISDRSGYVRTLAYDDKQRLSSVTDTFGRRLTFTYDDTDRIMAFTDPGGGVYTYRYGANNTLVSVIYPDGKVRSYLYENTRYPRALTGISDENSNRYATWSYDAQGRAVSSEHAGGADRVTLTYNTDGVTTNVTDALGATQLYTYANILGTVRLTGKTRSCAGCVPSSMSYTHDPNGNIASKTDFNGVTTTYTHDLTRNLELSRTEAYGTPQARTITTEWHPVFRLPTKITEPNRITTFTYDAQGNLLQKTLASGTQSRTWTYTYNSLGQVLTADGPRTDVADVTTYSYDNQGNLATVTNALGHVTRLTAHDAHGRPLTLQDPNGLVTQVAYDSRGRLISRTVGGEVTAYQYDGVGQLIKVTLPDASVVNYTYDAAHRLTTISDTLGNRIAYTLDPMGNRIKEEVYDPNGVLTQTRSRVYDALNRLAQHLGAQNQSTAYQYDANGNLTATTNPLSYTNTNSYDALNRLIQVTDPAGGITRYAYDASDRITQVTDPRGIGTAYTYDGLDSLTQTVSLDAGTTTNTYDANGNLTAQTDARNRKTTYTYDTLNRLTSTTFADGTAIAWQYDTGVNGLGRLTKMTDPSGNTQWTYSPQGRVLSKTQLTGTVSQNLSYAYDSAGRLSQITYPSVRHVGYSYDAAGRISSITLNGQPLLSNIQYQPHGPAKSWTLGNGTAYQRVFDADGRLTSHPQGSLSYDAASRPVLQQTPSGTHSYGYDAVDRLTGYAAPAGMTSSYQYDTNGNRTRLTQGGAVTDYAIPVTSNRLIGQSGTTPKNYTYDAAGNLIADGTYTYTYNARGRLSRVSYGTSRNTYALNGLGQRVMKTGKGVSTGTNRFVYDEQGHLLGEYNSTAGMIQETVYLGDTPVAVLTPTATHYIHPDHLDTPRAITDTANKVVWRWDSDPFGATAANEDPDGDRKKFSYNLRFPGQYFDKETGLHYNWHRYYDPNTGRYVTSDPIGLAGGLNPYAYVGGNPLSWFDSTGLFPNCESIILSLRTVSRTEKERTLLYSDYGAVFQSNGQSSLGPNLDPRSPGQLPIKPELIIEIYWARQDHFQWKEYLLNKAFQKLKVFCEETTTDKCGNTQTYRFNFTREEMISETKDLLRTYTTTDTVLLNLLFRLGI